MKEKRSQGFVLMVVLFFLQFFSLLSLYGLMTASLQVRMNRDLWDKHHHHLQAKTILRRIEKAMAVEEAMTCLIPLTATRTIIKKDFTWWQQVSCSGNLVGNQYHYVIELLEKDACNVIKKVDNNHIVTAIYYRITLFYLPRNAKAGRYFFQSIMTKASDNLSSCQPLRKVSLGRQLWREI